MFKGKATEEAMLSICINSESDLEPQEYARKNPKCKMPAFGHGQLMVDQFLGSLEYSIVSFNGF